MSEESIPHEEALLLATDPAAINLLEQQADEPSKTRYNTLQNLAWIKRTTGKTPTEFVRHLKTLEPIEARNYIGAVARKKSSPNAQLHLENTMRTLAHNNLSITIPKSRRRKFVSNKALRAYTLQEAQALRNRLKHPTRGLYHQLWVTIGAESGLRPVHRIQLQYQHIRDDLDNPNQPFIFLNLPDNPFRRTSKTAGYPFIGPASRTLINKIRTVNSDYLTKPSDNLFPLKRTSISEDMANARDRANIPKTLQPDHGLRRFFEKGLQQAGLDRSIQSVLMGWLTGMPVTYTDKQDIDRLRKEYARAYGFLDLDTNIELQEYKTDLDKTIKELRNRVNQLEQEREQINMKAQHLPEVWASMTDKEFNSWILFLRAKREQIKDPEHPLTKASDAQIIQAIKTINADESSVVLKKEQIPKTL